PALEYWRDAATGAKAVHDLCRVGIHVLSRFERALQASEAAATELRNGPERAPAPPVETYEFFLALFRHRLLGHASLKRRLRCHKDFIDFRERPGPGRARAPIIVPGVANERPPARGRDLITSLQSRCLEQARARTLDGPSSPWPIDLVPGRGLVDHLIVDGLD